MNNQPTYDFLAPAPGPFPFANRWSNFEHAGCCPTCGTWVKKGNTGKQWKVEGAMKWRNLYCPQCGTSFKAWEFDHTRVAGNER